MALNRQYLLNALRFGLNQFEVENPLSPVVFSNAGKKMVIMLINLEGPASVQPPAQTSEAPPATEQTATPANPEPPTEERTASMPRTAKAPEVETRETQTAEGQTASTNGNGSQIKSLVEHVDQIKDTLKSVIRDLNVLADALKQAEKEKRTSEKEIEAIRIKLRQIQSVSI